MAKKILITVIVLEAFQDKFDHKTQYPAGTELQVDKARAEDLVSRGLAKIKEEVAPQETKIPKGTKAPKTQQAAKVQETAEVEEKKEEVAVAADNPETEQEDESKGIEEQ